MQELKIHKWNGGDRKTTPILALHGFTGSGLDFECFAKDTEDFLSWWAPDLMGHGGAPVSEDLEKYTIAGHIGYLDAIAGDIGEPFVLLGYSMGGRLGLSYALERPELVTGLILVGASPGILDPEELRLRRESDRVLAESVIEEGVERFLKKWQEQPIIKTQKKIPDWLRKPMMERRMGNNALGLANSLRGMGTGVMEPLWGRLGELRCPVTLITGETDEKYCEIAGDMRKLNASIKHEVIQGAGHAAIWEKVDYFSSWLKSMVKPL